MKVTLLGIARWTAVRLLRVQMVLTSLTAMLVQYLHRPDPKTAEQEHEAEYAKAWKQRCAELCEPLLRMGYSPDEIVEQVQIQWHPREYRGLAEAEAAFKEIVVQREREIASAHLRKSQG